MESRRWLPWVKLLFTTSRVVHFRFFFAVLVRGAVLSDTQTGGLTAQPFQGASGVQELRCIVGDDALPPGADLMSMVLYRGSDLHVLSILNLRKRQCSTSADYVSCVIDESDAKRSVVRALVSLADLPEGRSREYGCNASVLTSDGRFQALSWSVTALRQRLNSKPFPGIPNTQELECTGAGLPSGTNLYAMSLYRRPGDRILSSVDIPKRECATSDYFNSCHIDDRDYRRTSLRLLVSDLREGEARVIGCNVSTRTSTGRFKVESWYITLRPLRGLTSRPFLGVADIQEVECTGSPLPPTHDLLTLSLFLLKAEEKGGGRGRNIGFRGEVGDGNVLSYANVGSGQCSTNHVFVACAIDARNARSSSLRALVVGLPEGRSRVYGCNLTSLVSGTGRVASTSWSLVVSRSAPSASLSFRPFQGMADIQTVECSGATLPVDWDLFSMVLYRVSPASARPLAIANLRKGSCSTSDTFVACRLDDSNSRRSHIQALVSDLARGQSRAYGCNLTCIDSGGKSQLISWSIVVTRARLTSRPFRERGDIRVLECTGSGLDAEVDVMSMVLFETARDRVLASVYTLKRLCSTSDAGFAACFMDRAGGDSRATLLRALLTNLQPGQTRNYGCNVTIFRSGGRVNTITWSLLIRLPGLVVRDFGAVVPVPGPGSAAGGSAVWEVECRGEALDSDHDLLTVSIFSAQRDFVLASVNFATRQCLTSRWFSSCFLDEADSRRTRLSTLLVTVGEKDGVEYGGGLGGKEGGGGGGGEAVVIGCNVTCFVPGGRVKTLTWFVTLLRLSARPFWGLPHIVEVQCSGEGLPVGTDLLSISLFDTATNRVLASVNFAQRKCMTSGGFASCQVLARNSRETRVNILVGDLGEGEVRSYGCDVSTFLPGERPDFVSWTLSVERQRLRTRAFQGHAHITEVECSGDALDSNRDLLTMVLYDVADMRVLATANLKSGECSTSDQFSSCRINGRDSHRTRLSTLLLDLTQGELRHMGCNLTTFNTDGSTHITSWTVYASRLRTTTTSTPTTTASTTTTVTPQLSNSKTPVASGVMGNVQEFQLPISVVIIGLVLLLFFAILCAILVILQCKSKRRRRSRAANRESLLSTKSEPVGGEGGYRTTRSMAGYPPGHMPPETPGGNFAMRYQKSIPDTGYVSGSSVYYSEPYGTLDEEMKERLRPNPRLCHIPYDLKGGPLDTHPQEHSA